MLARLDERRELRERLPPADLVVGGRWAARKPVVHGADIGATVGIGERDRDGHLATQCGTCRLELDRSDYLLVRHESHEAAVYVSVCSVVLPVPVGSSSVSEIRNAPPSRASMSLITTAFHDEVRVVGGVPGNVCVYRLDILDCLGCPDDPGHRRSRRFASV